MIITSVSFCAVASFPSGHLVPAAERLLNEVHNAQPNKDGFWFRKLENMLRAVGQYRLEFELQPIMPGREPLTISTSIHVSPGPPAALEVKARAYSHCALPVSGIVSACVSARSLISIRAVMSISGCNGARPASVCKLELQSRLRAFCGMPYVDLSCPARCLILGWDMQATCYTYPDDIWTPTAGPCC